jgi:prepilin peptidase CpaA
MSIRILILFWLAVCAVFDLRRREVPDWLTLPVLAAGLVWRVLHPDGWLAWALAGGMVALTLINVLPGGDMKGLAALALIDPRLYLAAWLGAGGVYLVWRLVRRECSMPGYVGFLVGVAGWMIISR